ncbi:MAG: DJ-1/PfpI family protein [Clostridia bacterium]|nr:DJ-1/PfpI family protein [Clostridia bacterium]
MAKIAVMLAEGFEEVEGLTVVDICRRANIEVEMTSVTGSEIVASSHGIKVVADKLIEDTDFDSLDMIILPGGMPGTINLGNHKMLCEKVVEFASNKKVGAICAAPSVLGGLGILNGKNACCYPGFEDQLKGANVSTNPVEVAGNVVTSRGVGTAIDFALAIVTMLIDKATADAISAGIIH